MKKTLCFFILHWMVVGFICQAQQPGQIHIIPKSLTIEGSKLTVEMVFDMNKQRLGSSESVTYTPIFSGDDNQYLLPQLIVKGGNRYKADRRKDVLNGRSSEVDGQVENRINPIYAIEKFNRKTPVTYRVTIDYSPWMSNSTFIVREETCGCDGGQSKITQRTVTFGETSNRPDFLWRFNFLEPEREIEKNRFDIGNAYLEFSQGGSAINQNFRNNQIELDKINQMISMLMLDPDVVVTSIEMRGYASPEGSAQSNYELSSQRAKAMRDYFVRRLTNIPSSSFLTGVGGEDWEGLKSLLMNYSVSYKDEILNIINTVRDLDQRERRIQQLGNGEPYRQIFRDLYPKLRRVDCQINYTARSFTVAEGKERMLQKGKLLSQHEMYQIANSYPTGSHEFNETLITAGQYFQGNDKANLNAAAAALSEGNPASADAYLKQVQNKNMPEYNNCMGVLSIYKGNYAAAEDFLRRAEAAGMVEASHNLRELQKRQNK